MMTSSESTAQILGTLREASYRPLTTAEILVIADRIADMHDMLWPKKKSQRLNEKMERILDGKVVI
jgi:hypothetical protein